jgi:hypothetical protein
MKSIKKMCNVTFLIILNLELGLMLFNAKLKFKHENHRPLSVINLKMIILPFKITIGTTMFIL